MKVVTAGKLYADIDVYAGIIAYAELLRAQGLEAVAVTTAPVNGSVPQLLQALRPALQQTYAAASQDSYILIDVSNPDFFESFVDLTRVEAVLDHHLGFEDYWRDRLGKAARIDFIGAACTLVYEAWRDTGFLGEMSAVSAKLLACGILDNTLNFGAQVTSKRDIVAYADLLRIGGLDESWAAVYFSACEREIVVDAVAAIQRDTKSLSFKTFHSPVATGQVAIWDGHGLLANNLAKFEETLGATDTYWLLNLIGVGERKSYFVTNNTQIQKWLERLVHVEFKGSVAEADRVWLRKELIKQDQTASQV
jgi:inorganic pyrophosphatase